MKCHYYLSHTNSRFFVPDLTPEAREELSAMKPLVLFVGESPHVSEVEADELHQRRPLCGAAGKQWWSLLSELLEGAPNSDVTLKRELNLCGKYRIAVMNAVQYPMDPKVTSVFPDADPLKNLGFGKFTGEYSYRKVKTNPLVQAAIEALRKRLNHPSVRELKVHPLGNDAEWLVTQALGHDQVLRRFGTKIPHPSAWWRQGGYFGRVAREILEKVLL